MGWLTGFGGGERVDGDQILRLLAEREAATRVEWLRLEEEAAQIAELIEQCRREIEHLTITREVLSGLVTGAAEAVSAVPDPAPDGVFADQLLTILAEMGRPVDAGRSSRPWARIRRWPGTGNGSGTG